LSFPSQHISSESVCITPRYIAETGLQIIRYIAEITRLHTTGGVRRFLVLPPHLTTGDEISLGYIHDDDE
jgi:hypothetical protein